MKKGDDDAKDVNPGFLKKEMWTAFHIMPKKADYISANTKIDCREDPKPRNKVLSIKMLKYFINSKGVFTVLWIHVSLF